MDKFRHTEFGAQVRRWRQAIQPPLTQRQLARQIGVSDGFLAHIETGRTLPGRKTIRRLSHALGVPTIDLFRAAGHLPDATESEDAQILEDNELRLFFRDDWHQLTDEERELLLDFVRMLKTRVKRRTSGQRSEFTPGS